MPVTFSWLVEIFCFSKIRTLIFIFKNDERTENNEWRVVAWDALKSTAGAVAQSLLSKPQKGTVNKCLALQNS